MGIGNIKEGNIILLPVRLINYEISQSNNKLPIKTQVEVEICDPLSGCKGDSVEVLVVSGNQEKKKIKFWTKLDLNQVKS